MEAQQVAMQLSVAAQQVAMLPWVVILPAPKGCPMSRLWECRNAGPQTCGCLEYVVNAQQDLRISATMVD